jgi:hypothetical protein
MLACLLRKRPAQRTKGVCYAHLAVLGAVGDAHAHLWRGLRQSAESHHLTDKVSWGRLTAGVSGWWAGIGAVDRWILLVYGRWPIS